VIVFHIFFKKRPNINGRIVNGHAMEEYPHSALEASFRNVVRVTLFEFRCKKVLEAISVPTNSQTLK